MLRKHLIAAVIVLGAWLVPSVVSAATLTIIDTYDNEGNPDFAGSQTIWTLEVETNCTTCSVMLTAEFVDPAGSAVNAYTDTYIDAVQWVISNPNVNPTDDGFNGTNAGTIADWTFALDSSLSANGCDGGAQDAVCGEWFVGGPGADTGGGFGPIVNGATYFWSFEAVFEDPLPETLIAGNIRAAFNQINPHGKITNYNIFSPNGGNFDDGDDGDNGGGEGGSAPEPAALILWGSGLGFIAFKLRRRRVQDPTAEAGAGTQG